jgi:hypothetical protein
VPQPDVTAFLADNDVSQLLKSMDEVVGWYAARQPHAASRGINSSLT